MDMAALAIMLEAIAHIMVSDPKSNTAKSALRRLKDEAASFNLNDKG